MDMCHEIKVPHDVESTSFEQSVLALLADFQPLKIQPRSGLLGSQPGSRARGRFSA